jgi:hypothetical protein
VHNYEFIHHDDDDDDDDDNNNNNNSSRDYQENWLSSKLKPRTQGSIGWQNTG